MRGKAHDENLFPLIFLSDHPVPRGGLTHERIPAFSSRPASHSSSSLSRISLDVTPLPPPHPSNGGEGKVRDRLPHCFGHLYIFLLEGTVPPWTPAGFKLMIRSVTCCGLREIKVPSELPEEIQRNTQGPHSGSQRTWRLWWEIQSERRAALRHRTESSRIQCHSSSWKMQHSHCQHIWEGGC